MASRGVQMALFLVVAAMFWVGAVAQSNSNCNSVLTSLEPCLNFLTGTSSTPSSSCCSQLGGVIKSSPDCLCAAINGSLPTMGVKINRTIALTLPDACQVKTSSLDQCKPVTHAASPPASPSTTSPSPSSSNKTTPPASGSESASTSPSDGGIRRAPVQFVLFLLLVASCASTIARF